jgi:hypothetical protein
MKKFLYILAGVVVVGTFAWAITIDREKKQNRAHKINIAQQIVAYGDSVIVEKKRILDILADADARTIDPNGRILLFSKMINQRTAINKRIYAYEWKIDSLKMILNK